MPRLHPFVLVDKRCERKLPQTKETTPHLPAPQAKMTASTAASPEVLQTTNLYSRLKDKSPKLTREQIDSYLKANGRTAANLLAAFRTSGDPALLKEAMAKFPDDPQVAFEAAFNKDLSPVEQRQWLDTFEKSAPDNALANYLSALNYFNNGQIDQGIHELSAASGKPYDDYTLNRYKNDEEAYLAAGFSPADAQAIASMQLLEPQFTQLKQLGRDMVDLANAYSRSGDTASAQAVLEMAANIGQSYSTPSAGLLAQLVSISVQTMALEAMNPNAPYAEFHAVDIWRSIIEDHGTDFTRTLPTGKLQQMPLFLAEMSRGISRRRLGLYPYVCEVLDVLREHYPLAIVTDAQSVYARGELHKVGLLGYFDPIIVSGDYGYRKPDRRLFQYALDGMGVAAGNSLYVGNDMYRDIYGARKPA